MFLNLSLMGFLFVFSPLDPLYPGQGHGGSTVRREYTLDWMTFYYRPPCTYTLIHSSGNPLIGHVFQRWEETKKNHMHRNFGVTVTGYEKLGTLEL